MGRPRTDNPATPVDSLRLQELSDRHNLMVLMASMGMTNKEIATRISMTQARVSIIRNSETFKEAVKETQAQMGKDLIRQRIDAIIPEAITVAHHIMLDDEEPAAVRVNTAFKFLDRAYGRPAQEIIHEVGPGVRELYEALDEKRRSEGSAQGEGEVINVTPPAHTLEALYGDTSDGDL